MSKTSALIQIKASLGPRSQNHPMNIPLGKATGPLRLRAAWDAILAVWTLLWCALVIGATLPIVAMARLSDGHGDRRHAAGRWIRRGAALMMRGSPLWRLRVEGELPRDGRRRVVVANHRSMMDVLVLSVLFADADWKTRWLAKAELFKIPWVGWMLRLSRDIPVRRADRSSRSRAAVRAEAALGAGLSLVVFPEGTRSRNGQLRSFESGGFRLAIGDAAPVLPIALRGTEACLDRARGWWPRRADVEVTILPEIETAGREDAGLLATEVADRLATALHRPCVQAGERPLPKLDRAAIEAAVASGRRLLVQGAMGIMASDGLPGKIARVKSEKFVPVGTISGVAKPVSMVVQQIERSRREAPNGYVGLNLMAAVNRSDFEAVARASLDVGVSFVVQGAGISREIIRWCRERKTPFVGIVSSGRLAAMYERWGADFLVAEGREAGGHLGDPDASLDRLLREVREASSLPVVAAGGLADGAAIGRALAAGAAGVQLATRFIVSSDCEVHPNFKRMHMGKTDADVVTITSTVKGMRARAIRNAFTERLAAGEAFPPKDKAPYYGPGGLRGRRKACDDCLAESICTSRESGHRQSFCISDALLRAAVDGDLDRGLFYTGQSVTGIREHSIEELKSVAEIVRELEEELSAWQCSAAAAEWNEPPRATPSESANATV